MRPSRREQMLLLDHERYKEAELVSSRVQERRNRALFDEDAEGNASSVFDKIKDRCVVEHYGC
jgi:hypothetical protein